MSRTRRRLNPKMKLGDLEDKYRNEDGTYREGTPQHRSKSCDNNKGCPYCYNNRKFHDIKAPEE